MSTAKHQLSKGDFVQDWSNTSSLATDNWTSIPSIVGYAGANLDVVDVTVNQTNPVTYQTGGVAEFDLANPTIALAGSNATPKAGIVLYLDASGRKDVTVSFSARDLDSSNDDATQPVYVEYRVGNGAWTLAKTIADATAKGSATLVTPVSVVLGADANNAADVQVRISTANASGNDEWVGIDDIKVTSSAPLPPDGQVVGFAADSVAVSHAEGNAGTTTYSFVVERSGGTTGDVSFSGSVASATADAADFGGVKPTSFSGTIPAGQSSAVVTISVAGDTVQEGNESFTLTLTTASNSTAVNTTLGTTAATGTIVNDDVSLTKISTIQGTGASSTMVGQTVTVEAIVVGDFQDGDGDAARNLKGFYIQEEAKDSDGNVLTSEGIFVYLPSGADVKVGDRVQVTGNVNEYYGMTQISASSVAVVEAGAVQDVHTMAAEIHLPAAGVTQSQDGDWQPDLEAYEGMLVTIPETLTITEQYNLDRFNEMKLTAGDRPAQYTQENAPSASGLTEYLQDVGSRTITYDDGLFTENAPISNLDGLDPNDNASATPNYATGTAPRMGDTITGLTGVLDYQWAGNSASGSTWRIRAIENGDNTFDSANPRPTEAPDVGGTLKVVSLNVLNYFKTLDIGSATTAIGADPRGADSATEFARQTEKLVNALIELDADVLGLVELENDFKPGSSGNALEYLVNQINAELGYTAYAWVNPGQQFVGGDAIAVGFLYKVDTVKIASGTQVAILNDADLAGLGLSGLEAQSTVGGVFDGENTSRNAVAVTFEEKATGEQFTAIANHLKSKSGTGTGADADKGDGQGNWQQQRELAATALAAWAASHPTGAADSDVVLLGDFNAYAKEDAISIIENGGFTNLQGSGASSYVFDGMTGTLDYIFGSDSILDNITGVAHWAINADEADALDYNTDYGRDTAIFDPNSPARISDHDPLVIGLDLSHDEIRGTANADDLVGTDDHDVIRAYAGDDAIYGGAGDDLLIGGEGGDVYTWISGDGNDSIVEAAGAAGSDALVIADLGRAQLSFRVNGDDVQIVTKDHEIITLKDQLVGGGVETVSLLGDGTVLDRDLIDAWARNTKPVAVADNGQIREGTTGLFDLVANDRDGDGNALKIVGLAVTSVAGIALDTTTAATAFSLVNNQVRVDTGVFASLAKGDVATVKLAYAIDDGLGGVATAEFSLKVDGATVYNFVYGDDPSETLTGTAGEDVIDAWFGNDVLSGLGGNDILIGGGGNDVLTGGAGADTFHFDLGDGDDVVTDFAVAGAGHDLLQLSKALYANFAELQDAEAFYDGANGAVIEFADGSSVTLNNVAAADLTVDHFRFV